MWMKPRHSRAYPKKGLSPVATAQRPISMLTQYWRKTPSAAAHAMTAPNFAVIQGQMTSSPAPMARPTMTAPGPVIFQKGFWTEGRSASRRDRIDEY
jgi:hypothetical protein